LSQGLGACLGGTCHPETTQRVSGIDRGSDDALTEAAWRVLRMLADGDSEGRIVWCCIKRAIRGVAGSAERCCAFGRIDRAAEMR
jgi:hypothetical protein